jgi:hypothetical protein
MVEADRTPTLTGEAWENAFMQEVAAFDDAQLGVRIEDALAALVARRDGALDILERLHKRIISVVSPITDDNDYGIDDLVFEGTN